MQNKTFISEASFFARFRHWRTRVDDLAGTEKSFRDSKLSSMASGQRQAFDIRLGKVKREIGTNYVIPHGATSSRHLRIPT